MTLTYTHGHGDAFSSSENVVSSSTADAWTVIGADSTNRTVNITGVSWDGAGGGAGTLELRDVNGNVFYHATSGSYPHVDVFTQPVPVIAPISYYDSEGSTKIVIYGTYV
ncbi:MAG: hypothetical protein ACTSV7_04500 [Candidatus Baldrarchaeia archaeon]